MAYKTMLRQLISRWGIMSIELQTAIDSDMAVINQDGTRSYVEMEPEVVQSQSEPMPAPDPVPSPIMPEPTIPEPTIPDAKVEAKPERKARTAAKTASGALFG
jgi:recombination protein RecT